jgi:Parvulin-like peptidyl-prolyl isomerase
MAAIGRIRKRSGLLIAIIGIALAAFVLGDLFQSNGRRHEYNIAIVDGEKISNQDYNDRFAKNLENMKRNSQTSLTSAQTYNLHNSTLEEMIKNIIMGEEYDALGMNVTSEELYDQFMGEDPHQWVIQSFTNADGKFDKEMVQSYLQNLDKFPAENRAQWLDFENSVKQDRLAKKYNNLIKGSYFMPSKFIEKFYNNKNEKATVNVVALRYANIADSTVVVADKDRKSFYEENKYRYETDETRDIDYVIFDVKPTQEDIKDAQKYVAELKNDFTSAENVANFVNANSDSRYDSTWMGRTDVPAAIETVVFDDGNQAGFVYGPYMDNNAYNLVRIIDFQNRADSLKASHILISYKGAYSSQDTVVTKERASQIADSLVSVLSKGKATTEKFEALAAEFSKDPSAKDNKGDLDWFTDGRMVYAFNEFVMNNPVGTVGKVETPFGYHVIKVTGKTAMLPKARIAVVSHEISPSTNTFQNVFATANKFVTENNNLEAFNAAIETQGLTKRTAPRLNTSTYQITGIDDARQMVRWAFDEKTSLGDVSSIFELDGKYVIAVLTNVIAEGYAPMDIVSEQAKYQILNKKKGELAVEKMKVYGNDFPKMVRELGAEIDTVTNLTLDSRVFGNFGVEGDVVGRAFGMKEGQTSDPIAGNSSAFVITSVNFTAPAPTTDYSAITREKVSQYNNKVMNNNVYGALREKAKIEDNRVIFY